MLFWLFLLFFVIGIVLISLGMNGRNIVSKERSERLYNFFRYHDDGIVFTGFIVAIITGVVLVVMICIICDNYIGIDAKIEQYREHYKALEFKVDSKSYRDEFGLLNKEVIDEIQEWNEELIFNKNIQRNFWSGIFYPNIYDEFETIDYERY